MTDTQIDRYRQAADAAQTRGDPGAANAAYARELAVRAEDAGPAPGRESAPRAASAPVAAEPAPSPPALSPAEVERAFAAMGWWDEGGPGAARAAGLRARWGADAAANLRHAEAFGRTHPDVRDALYRAGFGDHPAIVEVAAMLGRRYGAPAPRPVAAPAAAAPFDGDAETAFEDALAATRARIAEAQARGQNARAARLYQDELRLIADRRGRRPIVDGKRTA